MVDGARLCQLASLFKMSYNGESPAQYRYQMKFKYSSAGLSGILLIEPKPNTASLECSRSIFFLEEEWKGWTLRRSETREKYKGDNKDATGELSQACRERARHGVGSA